MHSSSRPYTPQRGRQCASLSPCNVFSDVLQRSNESFSKVVTFGISARDPILALSRMTFFFSNENHCAMMILLLYSTRACTIAFVQCNAMPINYVAKYKKKMPSKSFAAKRYVSSPRFFVYYVLYV